VTTGSPLIGAEELAGALAGEPPALLDVRWELGDPDGRSRYLAGHIPTAVFCDLEHELSAPASAAGGRHPLPELAELEDAARRWGVRDGGAVVVYDACGGTSAARAWWLLGWAGVERVAILDGGLDAWTRAGHPLERGEAFAVPGDVALRGGGRALLAIDDAAALARDGLLLDARAAERYRGEVEPVDPRPGHIPGAISAPTTENLGADGRFLDAVQLRRRFERLGASPGTPIGVYCGSGVSATHEIAALELAGFHAALFPGSWSAWSADPQREAALGCEPG
jgi:thiosulfate/3-mercaptopyruvate sulfurtransferase